MNARPQAYPNFSAVTATARCCHKNLQPRPVLDILLITNYLDATTLILETLRSIYFGLIVFKNWVLFAEGIIPTLLLIFNICNSIYIILFTRAKTPSPASPNPSYKISKFSLFNSNGRNHSYPHQLLPGILLLLCVIFNSQAHYSRRCSDFEIAQPYNP